MLHFKKFKLQNYVVQNYSVNFFSTFSAEIICFIKLTMASFAAKLKHLLQCFPQNPLMTCRFRSPVHTNTFSFENASF